MTCPVFVNGRCLYLECKGEKTCIQRTPAKGLPFKRGSQREPSVVTRRKK